MAIRANYPDIKPSLNLDFANTKQLDPRITFTRTTTATYYDGKTVAKAEENLLQQSQTFDNSYWSKSEVTVSANSVAAPDGTTTAETITETTGTGSKGISPTISTLASNTYTFSCYVKAASGTRYPYLIVRNNIASDYKVVVFDLGTAAVTQTSSSGSSFTNLSSAITSVGNSWYRISVTLTGQIQTIGIGMATSATPTINVYAVQDYAGDGTSGIYIWGAQLEQRSSVTAYTPTTTQPVTNYIPVLQTAAAGQARFDHNPTTGESLGLLIEEQRTNTGLQSEDFGTTWSATRTTLSTNARTSPAGTLTADKIIASTDNDTHFVSQTFTGTAASWTFSVYAKAVDYSVIALRLYNGSTQVGLAYYNLSTGATGTVTAGTASITSVGNGWYRCILTATLAASASCTADIQIASADNTNSFAGNAWNGVSIWGSQIELGSFPTSYIPTTSASVTRNADAASMTGTNFSSWYRADEGTFYSEAAVNNSTTVNSLVYSADNGATTARIFGFFNGTTGKSVFSVGGFGTTQASLTSVESYASNTNVKQAGTYKVNDFSASINSASVLTDTSGLIPTVDRFIIGSGSGASSLCNTIKKLAYYPKRLSNTELQALTTV